jgi:hypothetical protein
MSPASSELGKRTTNTSVADFVQNSAVACAAIRTAKKNTPPRAFFSRKRPVSPPRSRRFQPGSRVFFPDSGIWKKPAELLFTSSRCGGRMKYKTLTVPAAHNGGAVPRH